MTRSAPAPGNGAQNAGGFTGSTAARCQISSLMTPSIVSGPSAEGIVRVAAPASAASGKQSVPKMAFNICLSVLPALQQDDRGGARVRRTAKAGIALESGLGNGSGLRKTASTMPKIAVFAPIPSVSMAKAATANPGVLRKPRTAYTKALPDNLMSPPGPLKPLLRQRVELVKDAPGRFFAGFNSHVDVGFRGDVTADGPEYDFQQRTVSRQPHACASLAVLDADVIVARRAAVSFQVCKHRLAFLQFPEIDQFLAADLRQPLQVSRRAQVEREFHHEARTRGLIVQHEEVVIVYAGRDRFPAGVLQSVFQH